ncbi:uncharacterized protein LOC126233778 [Schistocerca nitens]|uniref:uncharacterized protein LOC126233778 n=1 Tax=Schistocerca nitens TaxID=7011 RepID=UPI002119A284|nr:uncharacterized protein LOC126233778 [Schistocerca nitens]
MMDAKSLSLPIEPGWTPGESPPFNNTGLYREMVGSLMHLTQGTRPDLSYAVNVASRVQDSPTQEHFALLKRIFSYLKSTITDGIKFTKPIARLTMVGTEALDVQQVASCSSSMVGQLCGKVNYSNVLLFLQWRQNMGLQVKLVNHLYD